MKLELVEKLVIEYGSPPAREVWVEIRTVNLMKWSSMSSPPAREVWVEIGKRECCD